jgi:hypothetical protein
MPKAVKAIAKTTVNTKVGFRGSVFFEALKIFFNLSISFINNYRRCILSTKLDNFDPK